MTNLKVLIKTYLLLFWGSIKYGRKLGKRAGAGVLFAVLGLFLVFSMGSSAVGQISAYGAAGFPELALYNSLMLVLILSILMALMRSGSNNTTSDAEMLLALPLSRQTILLAKSISKYLFESVPIFVFFLPALVVYFVMLAPGIGFLLRGILLLLLVPLLSVGFSYLLSWLFFKIGGKMRNPQVITTTLSMVCLVGFLIYNFSLTSSMGNVQSVTDIAAHYYTVKPLVWGVGFILSGNLLQLLLFLSITLLPFIVGILLNARIFGVHQKTWHSTKTQVDYRQHSIYSALMGKELRRYFTSTVYLLNTGFGMVMSVLFTVAILIAGKSVLVQLSNMINADYIVPLILILVYSFCAGMCYTAACSISLEGRQLWILKAHPVPVKAVFAGKVLTNIIITLPLTFICSVVASLYFELSFKYTLAVVLIPSLVCVMSALLGLVINLSFPKLDWDDETRVVKQSMASMLAFLVGVLPMALPFILYFIFLRDTLSFSAINIIAGAFILSLIGLSLLWLKGKGKKIFQAL